ncbi:unnamed protein product [Cuscuta epithymum]|uniref:BED-type domain-containing protein n=1 Tax=Cuscuta epithymum TaxID=186058 RepID=A0AAV0CIB0_9ASTE|nr:unnamed protein product [Cuscuta epithymum]
MFKPTGPNLDPAWEWNSLKDLNDKKTVTCDFCGKTTTGGITRAKRHQMGIRGDVGACRKTPADVTLLLKEAYEKKKREKEAYMELQEDEDDMEELTEILNIRKGKRPLTSAASHPTAKKVKGPLDLLYYKKPEKTLSLGKAKRQTSINDACDKEARARTIQYIERFLCRNGIAFNVVKSKGFKLMVEAIGNYGPHLKPPSYHECRVPFLKKELEYTKELLKGHEEERA